MLLVQKAEPILIIIIKIMLKYGKDYCFPSQEKILELLKRYRKIDISRATLGRWLRVIREKGLLNNMQRTKNHPIYGLQHKSSLKWIPLKGWIFMRALGHNVSKQISALIAKLKFKYPEFAARSTKKMLEAAKRNPGHDEFMRGIVEKLVKLPVIE